MNFLSSEHNNYSIKIVSHIYLIDKISIALICAFDLIYSRPLHVHKFGVASHMCHYKTDLNTYLERVFQYSTFSDYKVK